MQAAASLGYLPQAELHTAPQAQPLRLMVLIPEGSNRFLHMLGDVIGYAQDHWAPFNVRCQAAYIESFNPEALAKALLHYGKRCDGIAFMALEHPVVREAVAQLAEQGVPTVTLISDLSNSRRVAYVGLDNRAAGRTVLPAACSPGRAQTALELSQVPDRPRRHAGGQLLQPHFAGRPRSAARD